ncbi:MAG: DMT family transporter [Acidobacterium ailaaui]|nr:DMT family transporter [Pseudacidobacterium ailaaui]
MPSRGSKNRSWLAFAIITTIFWGVWGALIDYPEKAGFPETLIYVVWTITMIIPAIIALKRIHWKLNTDKKSVTYGLIIGLTGAGGQMLLFTGAITHGPAYLIFPIISLSPVITILLAVLLLKEKASFRGWIGITLALVAIPFLSYQNESNNASGYLWLIYSLVVFLAWGLQAFLMRFASKRTNAESIFFYMMISGLLLVPVAIFMTNFSAPINWGIKGPYAAFAIQILNSIGALMLVYAFRYGKAIIVSPLTNAVAPVITVIISLIIYQVIPDYIVLIGMILSVISMFILAFEEE